MHRWWMSTADGATRCVAPNCIWIFSLSATLLTSLMASLMASLISATLLTSLMASLIASGRRKCYSG